MPVHLTTKRPTLLSLASALFLAAAGGAWFGAEAYAQAECSRAECDAAITEECNKRLGAGALTLSDPGEESSGPAKSCPEQFSAWRACLQRIITCNAGAGAGGSESEIASSIEAAEVVGAALPRSSRVPALFPADLIGMVFGDEGAETARQFAAWRKVEQRRDEKTVAEFFRTFCSSGGAPSRYCPDAARIYDEIIASRPGELSECDLLAAHPYDPERRGRGVSDAALSQNSRAAARACFNAYRQDPSPRNAYQLARSVEFDGKPVDAADYYRRAASEGYAAAEFALAILHLTGIGVPLDEDRGIELLREASDKDFVPALFELGAFYAAEGRRSNPDIARWNYSRAAELGHPQAQLRFAQMLERGEGGAQNMEEALFWYRRAAGQNVSSARSRVAALERQLSGTADVFRQTPQKGEAAPLATETECGKRLTFELTPLIGATTLRSFGPNPLVSKDFDERFLQRLERRDVEETVSICADEAKEVSATPDTLLRFAVYLVKLHDVGVESGVPAETVLRHAERAAKGGGPLARYFYGLLISRAAMVGGADPNDATEWLRRAAREEKVYRRFDSGLAYAMMQFSSYWSGDTRLKQRPRDSFDSLSALAEGESPPDIPLLYALLAVAHKEPSRFSLPQEIQDEEKAINYLSTYLEAQDPE